MSNQKDAMLNVKLIKSGGKLVHIVESGNTLYTGFVKALEEGQVVDTFFDANKDDGTLAQLAKIHKCIRELAKDTGYSFEDMKLHVKRAAGLCIKKTIEGENYMVCKSFADCSKEDLGLAIQAIIHIGETVGINFK